MTGRKSALTKHPTIGFEGQRTSISQAPLKTPEDRKDGETRGKRSHEGTREEGEER